MLNARIFLVGRIYDLHLAWKRENHVQNNQHRTSSLRLCKWDVCGILYLQYNLHLGMDFFKNFVYEILLF
jgi:hypothetical protein